MKQILPTLFDTGSLTFYGKISFSSTGIERRQSIGSNAAPCDHLGCCRNDASLQQELTKEKENLQTELARANMELNAKVIV